MTRSRKRTPTGITCKDSDKPFKRREHRRERRAVNAAIANGDEPPATKEFGDPWNSPKDGKQYWPDARAYRK